MYLHILSYTFISSCTVILYFPIFSSCTFHILYFPMIFHILCFSYTVLSYTILSYTILSYTAFSYTVLSYTVFSYTFHVLYFILSIYCHIQFFVIFIYFHVLCILLLVLVTVCYHHIVVQCFSYHVIYSIHFICIYLSISFRFHVCKYLRSGYEK